MTDQPRSVAPVVTLFETYGSGAIQIGARVAEALGVPFLGQRFTSEEVEAGEMKAYQKGLRAPVPVGVRHLLPESGGSPVDGTRPGPGQRSVRQNHAQVLQAAAAGVVVLGRNATAILADRPGTLHVKLIGQLADRLARAARVDGIDAATAARRQKNEDRHRAEAHRSASLLGRDRPAVLRSRPEHLGARRAGVRRHDRRRVAREGQNRGRIPSRLA